MVRAAPIEILGSRRKGRRCWNTGDRRSPATGHINLFRPRCGAQCTCTQVFEFLDTIIMIAAWCVAIWNKFRGAPKQASFERGDFVCVVDAWIFHRSESRDASVASKSLSRPHSERFLNFTACCVGLSREKHPFRPNQSLLVILAGWRTRREWDFSLRCCSNLIITFPPKSK